MTAPARPLVVKWRGSSGGCGACDLDEIPVSVKREDSMLLDLQEAVDEHNALVAAYEADRALIDALAAALEDARTQLEHYELDRSGESYNNTTINAALAAAGRGK